MSNDSRKNSKILYFPIENPASYSNKTVLYSSRNLLQVFHSQLDEFYPVAYSVLRYVKLRFFETVDVAMENHQNLSSMYRRTEFAIG